MKYCLKCGKPAEVCDECMGKGWYNCYDDSGEGFYYRTECPKCKGIGEHVCKPEDLEEKSFEERWLEDEKEAKDESKLPKGL